eukprot:767968-Hanusia_phi.AAC.12
MSLEAGGVGSSSEQLAWHASSQQKICWQQLSVRQEACFTAPAGGCLALQARQLRAQDERWSAWRLLGSAKAKSCMPRRLPGPLAYLRAISRAKF